MFTSAPRPFALLRAVTLCTAHWRSGSGSLRLMPLRLAGTVSSARVCAPPSFACDRHGNKPARELVRRRHVAPRILLQGACGSDGMSAARSCSCALNVAISVWPALTRRLEAPCAAGKGAGGSTGRALQPGAPARRAEAAACLASTGIRGVFVQNHVPRRPERVLREIQPGRS